MNLASDRIRGILRKRHKFTDGRKDDFTLQSQLDLAELKLETEKTFTSLIVGVEAISLIVGGVVFWL